MRASSPVTRLTGLLGPHFHVVALAEAIGNGANQLSN